MNCITKNERKNTMKNNIVKPTIKVNQVYVRVCDGQKAFVRMSNRYAAKVTISHNMGYMSVGRDELGQFASLKKVN